MKTSDSDLKVNRNIYPDAVTCDRMRLIGAKYDQLEPIKIYSTLDLIMHSLGYETNTHLFLKRNISIKT